CADDPGRPGAGYPARGRGPTRGRLRAGMVRVRPRSLGGPGEVPVVVRADVPLGTDRCAAARAPWSPSGGRAGYLLRKRHCGGQSGSPGEDGGVVVVLLDVVG